MTEEFYPDINRAVLIVRLKKLLYKVYQKQFDCEIQTMTCGSIRLCRKYVFIDER